MIDFYIENFFSGHLVLLLASFAGSYYLFKVGEINKYIRLFVYFLWVTFFIDVLGFYSVYAYFEDYKLFSFIDNTPFKRNVWLFNSFKIISFSTYSIIFIALLKKTFWKKVLIGLLVFFVVSSIINLCFSEVFFEKTSAFTYITGTVLLLLSIISWYFTLLNSDKIINFYRNIFFYISVGALIWHLSITPLFIFNRYFKMSNPAFIDLHEIVLKSANFFLYLTFSIGFLICARKGVINDNSRRMENDFKL